MHVGESRLLGGALRALALPSRWAQPGRSPLRLQRYGADATVVRDERGIPWITAGSDRDLYFAVGFAQACDRLWQMDVLRRRARGRLSEVFGAATVEEDVRIRRLALERAARGSLRILSADGAAALQAFSDGVNAAVRRMTRRGGLPPEFLLLRYRPEPWSPLDSVCIVKQLGFDLGKNLLNEVFRSGLARDRPQYEAAFARPKYPADVPLTIRTAVGGRAGAAFEDGTEERAGSDGPAAPISPPMQEWLGGLLRGSEGPGSNAWAVSGKRSASGRPLLANDPHVLFTRPNLWYQQGMALTGDHEPTGYGVTVPGLPGLVAGANEELAFGITNSTIDTQDLALPAPGVLPDRWEEQSSVVVRGGDTVPVTAAGSDGCVEFVLPAAAGRERCVLFWSGFSPSTEIDGCLRMWRTRSYPEFRESLRGFGVPVLNFLVACADGTIALRTAGRVPRRLRGSGLGPRAYTDVAASWQDFLDFDELPETVDPPEGYIVSANNTMLPDDAPVYLGGDWAGAYRAPRIDELLEDATGITAEDCARWQMDVANTRAGRLLPHLLSALGEKPPKDSLTAACHDMLRLWNGEDTDDLAAPLLFSGLMRELTDDWVTARLGETLTAAMPDLPLQVDHLVLDPAARERLGIAEPLTEAVGRALGRAVARLAAEWGEDPSQWRNDGAHRIGDPHPLTRAVPVLKRLFGDAETRRGASPYSLRLMAPNASGDILEGAPWRFVAAFGPGGCSPRDVLRHGSSGHPLSPHYDDQSVAHHEGRLFRMDLRARGGSSA